MSRGLDPLRHLGYPQAMRCGNLSRWHGSRSSPSRGNWGSWSGLLFMLLISAAQGEPERALARRLERFVAEYDMEALLKTLSQL